MDDDENELFNDDNLVFPGDWLLLLLDEDDDENGNALDFSIL